VTERTILKVQRPLYSTDPDEHWLLYDARRRIYVQIPLRDISLDLKRAMGDEFKVYIYADYNRTTGVIGFLNLAPEQVW
jgi:hypothetical protein